ncbi:ribonuclease H-like domain-containing protein [Tanacetum coccineum]
MPPKPEVSEPIVKKPEVETSADKPKDVRKNNDAPIIEEWVSDSEDEAESNPKIEKKTVKPSFTKIEFVKSKKQVKSPRKTTVKKYDCDNHQRQFNNKKMVKPVWNYTQRVNNHNFSRMTHLNSKRNMVPKAVLMRSGLISLTTGTKVNTAKPKAVVNAARPKAVLNAVKENQVNVVKASAYWVWKPKTKVIDHVSKHNSVSMLFKRFDYIDAQGRSNGCLGHMTGNMSYLTDFKEIDGGYVAFGDSPKGGKITGKGTIKTGNLDFEDVYFVRELKFNLFSVSQMCDKKNSVLFNDTECIVLSLNFKLTDKSHVLLKVPRKNNMYSVDLKNIIPKESLTCLFAKATSDESNLWHKRLGHINFKTMNKLVKGNLVRVVTNDYSRFSWVFFLATKDETSGILNSFITRVENLIDQKVKVIRCDNGTEFKNKEMNRFYERKGIKREFSVARTPQQNGVVERKNRTLIEAARTMLAISKHLLLFGLKKLITLAMCK